MIALHVLIIILFVITIIIIIIIRGLSIVCSGKNETHHYSEKKPFNVVHKLSTKCLYDTAFDLQSVCLITV